jgi:hypothetical protein
MKESLSLYFASLQHTVWQLSYLISRTSLIFGCFLSSCSLFLGLGRFFMVITSVSAFAITMSRKIRGNVAQDENLSCRHARRPCLLSVFTGIEFWPPDLPIDSLRGNNRQVRLPDRYERAWDEEESIYLPAVMNTVTVVLVKSIWFESPYQHISSPPNAH